MKILEEIQNIPAMVIDKTYVIVTTNDNKAYVRDLPLGYKAFTSKNNLIELIKKFNFSITKEIILMTYENNRNYIQGFCIDKNGMLDDIGMSSEDILNNIGYYSKGKIDSSVFDKLYTNIIINWQKKAANILSAAILNNVDENDFLFEEGQLVFNVLKSKFYDSFYEQNIINDYDEITDYGLEYFNEWFDDCLTKNNHLLILNTPKIFKKFINFKNKISLK